MSATLGDVGNNTLVGGTGSDTLSGRGGADTLTGGAGDDFLYGDSKSKGIPTPAGNVIDTDHRAKITFVTESAGYKNALGMYVINADGRLSDVHILFANASLKGSGGDMVSKVSTVMAELKAGQRIGFFIAPDAFSKSATALSDPSATFQLVNSTGAIARMGDGGDVSLVSISKDGVKTSVLTASGTTLFFTDKALNADGLDHARVAVDRATGIVQVGFEDLLNGGDRDFDDVVFTVDLGVPNAGGWRDLDPPRTLTNRNDDIRAGDGNDHVQGGAGNDRIWGEAHNDLLEGGSGNDALWGGTGQDTLFGGSGDDALYGEDGNDVIEGGAGSDRIWDGAGADTVNAGSGRDTVWVGLGDDDYNGGAGFDIIDFKAANAALNLDLSSKIAVSGLGRDVVNSFEHFVATRYNDTIRGDRNATVFDGNEGHDWIRSLGGADTMIGGKGNDVFVFSPKDIWLNGVHQGVDVIKDFKLGEDKIDVFEITKNFRGDKFSLLKLEQSGADVRLLADLGRDGGWQVIAVLEKVEQAAMLNTMADWLIV